MQTYTLLVEDGDEMVDITVTCFCFTKVNMGTEHKPALVVRIPPFPPESDGCFLGCTSRNGWTFIYDEWPNIMFIGDDGMQIVKRGAYLRWGTSDLIYHHNRDAAEKRNIKEHSYTIRDIAEISKKGAEHG